MVYGWVEAAIAAVALVGSSVAADQSIKQQKKQTNYMRQQAALSEARDKRELVRRARIAQADAAQSAESQGSAGSSAAMGGQASIQSQTNSNLSFLDQYGGLSNKITSAGQSANTWAQRGNTLNSASNFALNAYSSGVFGG